MLGLLPFGIGLLTLALLGLSGLTALADGGGASSPEALAGDIAAAFENEDPLALVGLISPDELDLIDRGAYGDLANRLAQVPVPEPPDADDDRPLDQQFRDWLTIDVTELETSVEDLGDGVAVVSLDELTVEWEWDADEEWGGNSDGRITENDFTMATDDDVQAGYFVAVERGGGWYLSLAYTGFQYWVDAEGLPEGDFDDRDLSSAGADSPVEAVEGLLDAIESVDPGAVIDHIDPQELGGAIWTYRDAIEESIEEAIDDETDGQGVDEFTIDVTAEDVGGGAVAIRELEIVADDFTSTFEGLCFTGDEDGDVVEEGCLDDPSLAEGEVSAYLFQQAFLQEFDAVEVMTVERDGRWFMSFRDSVNHTLWPVFNALEDDDLFIALGIFEAIPADTTIELDDEVELEFTEDELVHMVEVEVEDGDVVALCIDGEPSWNTSGGVFFDEDGQRLDWSDDLEYGFEADADGMVRTAVLTPEPGEATSLDIEIITSGDC